MVRKGDHVVVLWPRYFDARLTCQQGRRVPKDLAVREPDTAWVASAAKKAGLEVTVEETVRHPSKPYRVCGRVLVAKNGAKQAVLRSVAAQMSKSD